MIRAGQNSKPRSLLIGLLDSFFARTGLNSIQRRQTAIAFLFIIGTAVAMGMVGFSFSMTTVGVLQQTMQALTGTLPQRRPPGI